MKRGARTKKQVVHGFRWRSGLLLGLFSLAAAGLVVRAAQMQVLDADFYTMKADNRHLRTETISAHRGAIVDRHGEPLAISTPVDSIWVEPRKLSEHIERLGPLARSLGMDEQALVRKLVNGANRQFLYLKRHLTPAQAERVLALELPGVNVQREYRRFYPAGEVTGHLVGFTDIDDDGQEGLEKQLNSWLAGETGAKRVLQNRYGRSIEDVESIRPARNGRTLKASIDLRVQYYAYRTLKNAVQHYKAETGSVVVLDVNTGEVLALVSQPGFNPNDRSQLLPQLYKNRGLLDIFEPGSSIKPFIVAAALDGGQYRPSSVIDTSPGYIVVPPKRIEDSRNLGEISLTTVLSRSSNVGITKVAQTLPREHMWQTFTDFGFGQLTGVPFPGEQSGKVPPFQDWRDISQATMAYGYGLSVTALQLAQAYATLGNDGVRPQLSLLAVDDVPRGQRAVSEDTARHVVRMLEEVVQPGATGAGAAVHGYRVAGKTGTAWKAEAGTYSKDKYMSIFAGLAPATDPRLAVVVVIDEPSGGLYYGGEVAAPVFADVMGEALRLMAIPPDAAPAMSVDIVAQAEGQ